MLSPHTLIVSAVPSSPSSLPPAPDPTVPRLPPTRSAISSAALHRTIPWVSPAKLQMDSLTLSFARPGQSFANSDSNARHIPSASVDVRPSGRYKTLSCGGSTISTLARQWGGDEEVSCDSTSIQPSGLKNADPSCGGCIFTVPNAGSASSSASATASAAIASATAMFKVDCGNATVPATFLEPRPWKVAKVSLCCQKKLGATCQAVGGPFSFAYLDRLDICKLLECGCVRRQRRDGKEEKRSLLEFMQQEMTEDH